MSSTPAQVIGEPPTNDGPKVTMPQSGEITVVTSKAGDLSGDCRKTVPERHLAMGTPSRSAERSSR